MAPAHHLSSLLLDERPLIVLPGLATKIGLNEAILLQQLHWKSRADRAEVHEGRRWVHTTMDALQLEFPFWSKSTLERTFKTLREAGYVEVKRGRDSNLYTVDTQPTRQLDGSVPADSAASTRQIDGSEPVRLTDLDRQIDGSPSIEEKREEGQTPLGVETPGHLPGLAPPAPPKSKKQLESEALEVQVEELWAFHVETFGAGRVGLTEPRRKTLRGGLKAVELDLDLCKQAIRGLKAYRDSHPTGSKDTSVSVIFETGMNDTRNRTEKIVWWAGQAQDGGGRKASAVDAIPQLHRPIVSQHIQRVNRKLQGRAETNEQVREADESAAWLRENWQLEGKPRGDGTISWEKIA